MSPDCDCGSRRLKSSLADVCRAESVRSSWSVAAIRSRTSSVRCKSLNCVGKSAGGRRSERVFLSERWNLRTRTRQGRCVFTCRGGEDPSHPSPWWKSCGIDSFSLHLCLKAAAVTSHHTKHKVVRDRLNKQKQQRVRVKVSSLCTGSYISHNASITIHNVTDHFNILPPMSKSKRMFWGRHLWKQSDCSVVVGSYLIRPALCCVSLSEMWYWVFLWCLFSSLFVHGAVGLLMLVMLQRHKRGRLITLVLVSVGFLASLSGGVITSKSSNFCFSSSFFCSFHQFCF